MDFSLQICVCLINNSKVDSLGFKMWGSTSLYLEIWLSYDLSKHLELTSMVKIRSKMCGAQKIDHLHENWHNSVNFHFTKLIF